jgi:hypothetical protein
MTAQDLLPSPSARHDTTTDQLMTTAERAISRHGDIGISQDRIPTSGNNNHRDGPQEAAADQQRSPGGSAMNCSTLIA